MSTRNFQEAGETNVQRFPAKGSVTVFAFGEIIMLDATGFGVRGSTAVGQLPAGVCKRQLSTVGAADGDLNVEAVYGGDYVEVDNSTGLDAVLLTDRNQPVYTLDANAVSRLSAGKSKLGVFKGFSANGRVRVQILPN
jgi:hypothetical protein